MEEFRDLCRLIISFFLILGCFFIIPDKTYANSKVTLNNSKIELKRSLESLQDFDYQTWQIIVYPTLKDSKELILRIVGNSGSLRIDHPTDLIVTSGIKSWNLKDITKYSKTDTEIFNDSAAEFDISPLISELDKNRPLRLRLPGLINELPIPPYLVNEWRSLASQK